MEDLCGVCTCCLFDTVVVVGDVDVVVVVVDVVDVVVPSRKESGNADGYCYESSSVDAAAAADDDDHDDDDHDDDDTRCIL
jgi:hypothetical protein